MKSKDPNIYPRGLDAAKVKRIIDQYDRQSPREAADEIASAPRVNATAWIEVPQSLLPRIRKLLAGHKQSA